MTFTLEELYTSAAGFAVPASPTQRAILRAIEGRSLGELAAHPAVVEAFGGEVAIAALPTTAPTEFDLLAGIRTGKSQIAACRALHASQTVDVSGLAAGEVPRVSVLSLDLDKADVVLDHLVGTMLARPALRGLLLEEPANRTVRVRHPSGRPVEIAVVAGSRAGGSVVARWSAGVVFDEFARMLGSADGAVVNFDDARRGALGRLLPGATVLSIGSPWAPFGPAYERFLQRHGKPTVEHVVVRARADAMNPQWWTEARIERLKASDDLAYQTDVLAEFADPSESFILQSEIKRATREGPAVLPPSNRPRKYMVGVDPGTRGNAFAMILLSAATFDGGEVRYQVVMAREWRGTPSAPLSPWETFRQIRNLIAPYGDPLVVTDQHSADAYQDICVRLGVRLKIAPITAQNRSELFESIKGVFATGAIEIPPDRTLQNDLASVRRRLTVTGIGYDLPRTGDGRHGDYVPALALALVHMGGASEARAAAHAAERARKSMYIGALLGGTLPPAVAWSMPAGDRTEALYALANGASHESLAPSVVDLAGKDWRDAGGEERNRAAHDDYLNSIGSPAGSKYVRPDPEVARERESENAALNERVLARLEREKEGRSEC
jgi:hypothetical protein